MPIEVTESGTITSVRLLPEKVLPEKAESPIEMTELPIVIFSF